MKTSRASTDKKSGPTLPAAPFRGLAGGRIGLPGAWPGLFALGLALAVAAMTGEAPSPAEGVTVIDSAKVTAAFAKGMPLLENSEFKVHAGRRTSPGIVEIHTRDTDIIHVLEGSATLVTGGTAVEPKNIAADEIRGKEIKGGDSRRIVKGDVIVIRKGIPHWFKEVDGTVLYYVVKVTSVGAGAAEKQ